jgi:hypothetical protein
MNHNAITGWIVAIATALGGVLYIGNLNGKMTSLESELRNTTSRVDGLYVFVAEHGGSVKKAVMSSNLDETTKKQIINSFLPIYEQLKPNLQLKEFKD